MPNACLEVRHLERLLADRALDAAAANALHADAGAVDRAVLLHDLDVLQVRLEQALADAGHLAADAAEVLGLAAPGVLVAQHRLLAADVTLHAHGRLSPSLGWSFVENIYYSDPAAADKTTAGEGEPLAAALHATCPSARA